MRSKEWSWEEGTSTIYRTQSDHHQPLPSHDWQVKQDRLSHLSSLAPTELSSARRQTDTARDQRSTEVRLIKRQEVYLDKNRNRT